MVCADGKKRLQDETKTTNEIDNNRSIILFTATPLKIDFMFLNRFSEELCTNHHL